MWYPVKLKVTNRPKFLVASGRLIDCSIKRTQITTYFEKSHWEIVKSNIHVFCYLFQTNS